MFRITRKSSFFSNNRFLTYTYQKEQTKYKSKKKKKRNGQKLRSWQIFTFQRWLDYKIYQRKKKQTTSKILNEREKETYSESIQTSKLEHSAKLVNCWKPLFTFAKSSILYLWLGSEYASERYHFLSAYCLLHRSGIL